MRFIDQCKVEVAAGKGGNGIVSFRHEFRIDRGGPDGGDGGDGGSVYFIGDPGMNTLLNLKYMKKIKGNNGENGMNKNRYGARGEDRIIKVPLGTLVYSNGKLLCDVTKEEKYLIAKGGKGGKGNLKFKSSKNTAPRLSENGLPGEKHILDIQLKVLADIGFVGKPSAGKSTLLSKLSNAKPKIADYAFTTLTPQLGLVKVGEESFVAADLPGLIEGASQGKGLGHEFLKHIERCKVIAHIIDFGDESKDPISDYETIWKELKEYSFGLEKRKEVIVANKADLPSFTEHLKKFKKKFPKLEVIEISAMEEKNIDELKYKLNTAYKESEEIVFENVSNEEITITKERDVIVKKNYEGVYELSGKKVIHIYNLIPLNTDSNYIRFNRLLKEVGAWKALRESGIKEGDTVQIEGFEFTWTDEEE